MRIALPLLVITGLFATSCAGASVSGPPVCDGEHKRPANPYGSILNAGEPASSASVPAPPPSAPTETGLTKTGPAARADRRASEAPCGRARA